MFSAVITYLNVKFLLSAAMLDDFSEGFWYGVIVTLISGGFLFVLFKFWKSVTAFFYPDSCTRYKPWPKPCHEYGRLFNLCIINVGCGCGCGLLSSICFLAAFSAGGIA